MNCPRDPEQIDFLFVELSDDVAAHKKCALARAEKLNARRKSDRARKAAQARWNAQHGKAPR
jgi:hypothetical protein